MNSEQVSLGRKEAIQSPGELLTGESWEEGGHTESR